MTLLAVIYILCDYDQSQEAVGNMLPAYHKLFVLKLVKIVREENYHLTETHLF
jgi:hypothetical protein